MGDFPSGQRGQTVNLLATPSVVRIHHRPLYADVAQLAEQLICNQQVKTVNLLATPSVVRIHHRPLYADVAQLAEQLICNQQVIGSSPIIGLDCKSAGNAFGGSNPPSPIICRCGSIGRAADL